MCAEAVATCVLVTTVVGSGIRADNLSEDDGVTLIGTTIVHYVTICPINLSIALPLIFEYPFR